MVCGDGIVEGTEECDDGNQVDNDFCDNDCLVPVCGDEVVEGNETCDLGDQSGVEGSGCTEDCMNEVPTLGEWGLIVLALILGAMGVLIVRSTGGRAGRQRLRI